MWSGSNHSQSRVDWRTAHIQQERTRLSLALAIRHCPPMVLFFPFRVPLISYPLTHCSPPPQGTQEQHSYQSGFVLYTVLWFIQKSSIFSAVWRGTEAEWIIGGGKAKAKWFPPQWQLWRITVIHLNLGSAIVIYECLSWRWMLIVLSSTVSAKRCDDDMRRKSASAVIATEWHHVPGLSCVSVRVWFPLWHAEGSAAVINDELLNGAMWSYMAMRRHWCGASRDNQLGREKA